MMKCDYCGEASHNVIVIPKPNYFMWKDIPYHNLQINNPHDFVCLTCLDFELNLIKDN